MKKIELNILLIIVMEAVFLLFLFKINIGNSILGLLIGFILINLSNKIKKNNITRIFLLITSSLSFLVILYKTTHFINYNILNSHSPLLIILSLLITIFYSTKNYHSFIKTSEIIFYIIIIFKVLSFILIIPLINFSINDFHINFNYHFIYISIIILFIYKCLYYLTNNKVQNKIIAISFLNPFYIKLLSLLVLNSSLSNIYQYPYVNYLKEIKYLNFIERVDGIFIFEYILCFIILLSFNLLCIKKLKKPI